MRKSYLNRLPTEVLVMILKYIKKPDDLCALVTAYPKDKWLYRVVMSMKNLNPVNHRVYNKLEPIWIYGIVGNANSDCYNSHFENNYYFKIKVRDYPENESDDPYNDNPFYEELLEFFLISTSPAIGNPKLAYDENGKSTFPDKSLSDFQDYPCDPPCDLCLTNYSWKYEMNPITKLVEYQPTIHNGRDRKNIRNDVSKLLKFRHTEKPFEILTVRHLLGLDQDDDYYSFIYRDDLENIILAIWNTKNVRVVEKIEYSLRNFAI